MDAKDKTAFQAAREGFRDAQAGKPPMNPYADDHETPQLAVAYDNGYEEGEKAKLQWTVWWFETDPFIGFPQRVYRDFVDGDEAARFAASKRGGAYYGRIQDCLWHHRHASLV